jgi:broad specificity phosphatase PhoE
MKIILVRHGESEANVAHQINDDPQRVVNLTERGKSQAAVAAEALRGAGITHAYVSEFPRAQQTAAILLRYHACTLNIDARLNERRSGMDGQHVDIFNDLVRADPLRIRPPRGESFLQQMERVRSFLEEKNALHPDALVLAVSHENPILAAMALAGEDPGQAVLGSLANCEMVELVWPAAIPTLYP